MDWPQLEDETGAAPWQDSGKAMYRKCHSCCVAVCCKHCSSRHYPEVQPVASPAGQSIPAPSQCLSSSVTSVGFKSSFRLWYVRNDGFSAHTCTVQTQHFPLGKILESYGGFCRFHSFFFLKFFLCLHNENKCQLVSVSHRGSDYV